MNRFNHQVDNLTGAWNSIQQIAFEGAGLKAVFEHVRNLVLATLPDIVDRLSAGNTALVRARLTSGLGTWPAYQSCLIHAKRQSNSQMR
jgi:hypothetical protein